MTESRPRSSVAGDPGVDVMAPKLAAQCPRLLRHRLVTVAAAPMLYLPHGSTEASLSGLAVDHPAPLPEAPPIVREAKPVELRSRGEPCSPGRDGRRKSTSSVFFWVPSQPIARKTLGQHVQHPPCVLFPLEDQQRITGASPFFAKSEMGSVRFRVQKISDGHGLRRPTFVLRPSRRALRSSLTLPRFPVLLLGRKYGWC